MTDGINILEDQVENYYPQVLSEVEAECGKAGRDQSQVTLIAVSKTKPVHALMAVYDTGCRDFGENKVQELTDKYEKMPKDINWHMIGHLQRNKVKYIADKVAMIHSVDSLDLAVEISRQAVKHSRNIQILIEVNIGGEESKFGVRPEDTEALIRQIALLDNITIRGLMTVAPYVENPEENRPYFVQMSQLCVDIRNKNIDNTCMDVLSMGMTNDYKVAIDEGATLVRVGTGIFGERIYSV